MRKSISTLMFAVLLALLPTVQASATCTPGGYCPIFGCNWFNWVANSSFYDGTNCWTFYGNSTVKSDGAMCMPLPYVEFGLGLSSGMQQVVHVAGPGEPGYINSAHNTHFEFDYRIQFIDPHHDANNIITIGLYDNNTGALLQWITTVTGANTDPACGLTYADFTNASLLGKNVRIQVSARSAYSDTKIRVTALSLWQSTV